MEMLDKQIYTKSSYEERNKIIEGIVRYLIAHDEKYSPMDLYHYVMQENNMSISDFELAIWAMKQCEELMPSVRQNKKFYAELITF